MSNRTFYKKMNRIPISVTILCVILLASVCFAQPSTHRVIKGDTLWSICEKYYGDPNLWPRLWEMNSFVTNPHLLHTGDVITLFKKEPAKKEPPKPEPIAAEKPRKPLPEGIDISVRTNSHNLGYLSLGPIGSWGTILSSENGKDMQYKDDIVYLRFVDGVKVEVGDEFTVIRQPDKVSNPLFKNRSNFPAKKLKLSSDLGFVVRFEGRLVVEKFVGLGKLFDRPVYQKPQIYQARVTHSYRSIHVGHMLIPSAPVSPCVKPVHLDKDILGNIVAAKEKTIVFGADSVVYINKGFNQGVQRGHLFEIVKTHVLPDQDITGRYVSQPYSPTPGRVIILPDIPVGILMIVESRPDTSVAMIVRAKENVKLGYYVKTLYWDKIPRTLQRLKRCELE